MKRWMSLLLVLALCLSLCACGSAVTPTEPPTEAPTEAPTEPPEPTVSPEELARQAAYHEKMEAALGEKLDGVISSKERWEFEKKFKAVEVVKKAEKPMEYGESIFTDAHIDPKWAAEEPGEVRFVVNCAYGVTEKGWYPIGGGKAYQRWVSIKIDDLGTGVRLGENVFYGSEPPESVSEPGDHYGSEVDEDEIRAWINSVIEEKAKQLASGAAGAIKAYADKWVRSRRDTLEYFQQNGNYSEGMLEYALEICGVDWKENALQVAMEELADQPNRYLGYFSYHYTIEYLTDTRGFAQEEAVYAADNCGADWKEQCCLQVKQYLEDDATYNDSRKWLVEYLRDYDLFTDEEIEYALAQCGVE